MAYAMNARRSYILRILRRINREYRCSGMPHPFREIRAWKLRGKRSVDRPALPERPRNPDRDEEFESFIAPAFERLEGNRQFKDIPECPADVPGTLCRVWHGGRFHSGIPDLQQ